LEFDFTEAEMYAGMRLILPEAEARIQAAHSLTRTSRE
jgi:hypothetical protein